MAAAGVAIWHSDPTGVGLSEPLKIIPLTSYPGYERYASFSPDGSHVAFSWKEETRGQVSDLYQTDRKRCSGAAHDA